MYKTKKVYCDDLMECVQLTREVKRDGHRLKSRCHDEGNKIVFEYYIKKR